MSDTPINEHKHAGVEKTQKPRVKESEIQKSVLDSLRVLGVFAWRMPIGPILHSRGRGSNVKQFWRKNHLKGMPDIMGILRRKHHGRAFFLEIKTEGGKLAPEQIKWMVDLQASGAACAVIRSMDELYRIMREWGEIG